MGHFGEQKRVSFAERQGVTTNAVPGERTVRTISYVEALSEAEAASDRAYRLAEKQALLDLARQGLALGANAIVGLRKSNAHYDQDWIAMANVVCSATLGVAGFSNPCSATRPGRPKLSC
ncbi:MAG: hypothetical protein V5B30_20830 [Candidatus Accumulibacter delftensis]